MWPYMYPKIKHDKWEFLSLNFMAYFMGSRCGSVVVGTSPSKTGTWKSGVAAAWDIWLWTAQFCDIRSKLINKNFRQMLSSKTYFQKKSTLCALVSPSCLSGLQKGWRWTSDNTSCNFCNCWHSFVKLTWTDSYWVCFSVLSAVHFLIGLIESKTCTIKALCAHVCAANSWLCFGPFLSKWIHFLCDKYKCWKCCIHQCSQI